MQTTQITMDVLADVDRVSTELRSAFMRLALQLALRQHRIRLLERQQAEGYARYPVQNGEFDVWPDAETL